MLLMPQEKDRQDEEREREISMMQSNTGGGVEEAKANEQLAIAPSQASGGSRMGGRIGARMDGLRRAGEDDGDAGGDEGGNQPRSNISDEDDLQINEVNQIGQINQGNKVAREPEREPSKDPNYLLNNLQESQFNIDDTLNDGSAGQIND